MPHYHEKLHFCLLDLNSLSFSDVAEQLCLKHYAYDCMCFNLNVISMQVSQLHVCYKLKRCETMETHSYPFIASLFNSVSMNYPSD